MNYPTDVQAWPLNVTNIPDDVAQSTANNAICVSGKTYTVVSGDGCNAIAAKNNVATRTLGLINNILPDCSNLIAGGSL